MEYDDKIRDDKGLVISLRDMGNGTSRLFFDDVVGAGRSNPITWLYDCFYTFSPEFDNATLEDMELSADDFERIGVLVVARLLASTRRVR